MRLLFIRHGDPDYVHDSLTDQGVKEANALSDFIGRLEVGDCYVSPLGRARLTAQLALQNTGITPVELDWIQEFLTDYDINGSEELQRAFPNARFMKEAPDQASYRSIGTLVNPGLFRHYASLLDAGRRTSSVHDNCPGTPGSSSCAPRGNAQGDPLPTAHDSAEDAAPNVFNPRVFNPRVPWDIIPEYYTKHPELSNPDTWRISTLAKNGGEMPDGTSTLLACYDYVCNQFDAFLASYGYRRSEGGLYLTEHGTEKTVTFFCHFGITAILLSHLWNTSPFLLLQSLCMAPTSVTEVVTEEREEGRAYFRALRIGDTSHLAVAGLKPSFAARFCETFHNKEQRH